MVLRTYTIEVPEGYSLRCPTFYKKKSMADDYVETRGRPQKEDYDIETPDDNLLSNDKEMKRYYNRVYYIRKKNGLVHTPIETKVRDPDYIERRGRPAKILSEEEMLKKKEELNERFKCECGGSYTKCNQHAHLKTNKHKKFIAYKEIASFF